MEQHKNGILIDALEVTLHGLQVDEVKSLLCLQGAKWQYENFGRNNYPRKWHFHHIDVLFGCDDPECYGGDLTRVRSDMGIRIEMSGQGCRAFETYSSISWVQLLSDIISLPHKTKFTRIDLAYDDHEGVLDLDRIYADWKDLNFTSILFVDSEITSRDRRNDITGRTVYLGSKKCEVFCRIYDKAAEREYSDNERHWVRVELSIKHDRADVCCTLLANLQNIGKVFSGVLRKYWTFRTPMADSNKSRWPVADYWSRLLSDADSISLFMSPGEPYNALKTREHVLTQYAPTLLVLVEVYGASAIFDLMRDARKLYPDGVPKKYRDWAEGEKRRLQELKAEKERYRIEQFDALRDKYSWLPEAGLSLDAFDEYIESLMN